MVRLIRSLAVAAGLLAATTCQASADPTGGLITYSVISFLAVEGGLGVSLAATITPYLLAAGVVAAGSALSYLTAPRPGGVAQGVDPGSMKETFEATDSPEIRAVGRVRVAGAKAFGNTKGATKYRLVLNCKGEIDGPENFYIGGFEVVVDVTDGSVTSPPWLVPTSGPWAFLSTKNGDGAEVAWPQLIADFPALWTSDHRVRGIAQMLAIFISPGLTNTKFLQLYQSGAPEVEIVLRAENGVYDARTALTGWTENGVCNALHILRSYPEISDLSLYDLPFLAAQAALADIPTLRRSGASTPASRCCGFWSSETARGDTMQQVLDSIGAIVVPRLGAVVDGIQQLTLGIQLLDDLPAAELTLPAKHLLDMKWYSGPQSVERPNVCRVKYYSPEQNYQLTEIDLTGIAWARIDDEIAAYGEKPYDVTLPFCPDSGQAQQIARRKFALARADTGVATYNLAGLAAWGARFVDIEFPDDGGTFLCAVGVPRVDDGQAQVQIPFVVRPDLPAWDSSTDEAPAPAQLPDFEAESVITQPAAPTAATKIVKPDASVFVRVGFAIPADAGMVEATCRVVNSGLPGPWRPMTEYGLAGMNGFAEIPVDLSGLICDFRLRTFANTVGDTPSFWSPALNVLVGQNNAAPAIPTLTAAWDVASPRLARLDATAPSDLQVAYWQLTGPAAPAGSIFVRPGDATNWSYDASALPPTTVLTWTAQAFSSNGTGGPIKTVSLTVT